MGDVIGQSSVGGGPRVSIPRRAAGAPIAPTAGGGAARGGGGATRLDRGRRRRGGARLDRRSELGEERLKPAGRGAADGAGDLGGDEVGGGERAWGGREEGHG